jgi:hypothetical protein
MVLTKRQYNTFNELGFEFLRMEKAFREEQGEAIWKAQGRQKQDVTAAEAHRCWGR